MGSFATPEPPAKSLLPAASLGAVHAVVDGCCAALVASLGLRTSLAPESLWRMYFVYNLLAFGTQFALGVGADRRGLYRPFLVGGLLAVLAGVVLGTATGAAWVAVAAVGLGNAAFHVGAGAVILRNSPDRAAPIGVFVAPGALGLAVGQWAASGGRPWSAVGAGLLLVCLAVAWRMGTGAPSRVPLRVAPAAVHGPILGWALSALMLSVAIRSAAGFAVGAVDGNVAAVAWALTLAAVAGKAVGGFAADRLGWLRTSVIATLLAAVLLGQAGTATSATIAGTLFLQVTMSVTLTAIYRAFPDEPGLAFGLPSLALLVGALPSLVFASVWTPPPLAVSLCLFVSALGLVAGLPPLLGIRYRAAWRPDRR